MIILVLLFVLPFATTFFLDTNFLCDSFCENRFYALDTFLHESKISLSNADISLL